MLDSGPVVKCVKPGTKVKIRESFSRDEDEKTYTYIVVKVYPFMVMAERDKKIRRCFSYGDLVIAGLEKQVDEIEAKRRFTEEDLKRRFNNKQFVCRK